MRLLDLFCGAGGAAMGYARAGFDEIVGVDIEPQPNYPFTFVQADALEWSDFDGFDLIHASPPCQAYSTITPDQSRHERLIPVVRDLISAWPYVIENVEGARKDLRAPTKLCGSSFGLEVRRHRYFESSFALMSLSCAHGLQGRPIGVYGDHGQNDHEYRRPDGTRRGAKAVDVEHARAAMGMNWGEWGEISQAIPPAYTEFIGEQFKASRSAIRGDAGAGTGTSRLATRPGIRGPLSNGRR
jgi:DNA (cytosine-5)-methyltransferase 1